MHISVGCALENLLIAAEHFGYGHQITYFSEPAKEELAAAVKFMPHGEPSPFRESVLFEAIPVRRTNRKVYEELGYLIGQGVFGTPWLMSKMAQFAVTYMNMSKGQAKKDSEVLMSAPVLAVLNSEVNDRKSQVKVGQVFERVCLAVTMLRISVHPMSQILEIPELKT